MTLLAFFVVAIEQLIVCCISDNQFNKIIWEIAENFKEVSVKVVVAAKKTLLKRLKKRHDKWFL